MSMNPFLEAFGRLDLADIDTTLMHIVVKDEGREVGEIIPARPGHMEMAYARFYRGVTRGVTGQTPIGPSLDIGATKRRIVSVMFNGDEAAFTRANLHVRKKPR